MRFLFVIFLSFLISASSAEVIIVTKPPQWPASYSTDYQSKIIDMKSSITGTIRVSKNDKILSNSQMSNSKDFHQSIILRDGSIANIYHIRKSFEQEDTICRHFQRPYDLFEQNLKCREFQSKGEELIDGQLTKGWTTICSMSPLSFIPHRFHHPPPSMDKEIDISLTYYYQNSLPYAIIVAPLSGPGVNMNVTINYSNFQLSEPDESLFILPTVCTDIEKENPWRGRFGRGRHGRHHPPPPPHPNNNDEQPPEGEPIPIERRHHGERPDEGRPERPPHGFRPHPHDDKHDEGIFARIFHRLFGGRHSNEASPPPPPMEAPPAPPMMDIDRPMPGGEKEVPPLPPMPNDEPMSREVEPRPPMPTTMPGEVEPPRPPMHGAARPAMPIDGPMRGGMIGGGMDGSWGDDDRGGIDRMDPHHHHHRDDGVGNRHSGERMNDFRQKRLSAHITRMAMKLIHFVNTNYLQKSQ